MNRTALLLVALLAIITGVPLPGSATPHQVDASLPVDLAAMALTGSDIENVPRLWRGAGEYRMSHSETMSADAYIAHAAYLKEMPETALRDQIEAAGIIRAHITFFTPVEQTGGDRDRTISSLITEYANADGAAAAWRVIQDESAMAHAADVDGLGDFGDASEGTLETGLVPDTGEPYAQLDSTVLLGRFHLGVTIVDWEGVEPAVGYAHLLTRLLLARAEPVIEAAAPGLSTQALRLTGETVTTYLESYTWFGSQARPIFGPYEDAAAVTARAELAGISTEFLVWQQLIPVNDADHPDADLYVTIVRFVDDDAAAAWVENHLAESLAATASNDVEQVGILDAGSGDFGANAHLSWVTSAERGATYSNLIFQQGDTAVRIALEVTGPTAPPVEILIALATFQQACLTDGPCLEPMEMPDLLADFIAGL